MAKTVSIDMNGKSLPFKNGNFNQEIKITPIKTGENEGNLKPDEEST